MKGGRFPIENFLLFLLHVSLFCCNFAFCRDYLQQDTFLRAFSHIGSYDPHRASLATWLSRIAYRLTLDFLKRRRPLIVSIEDTMVWQTDISDEQIEAELSTGSEERIQRLMLLMDDLPPYERLLLTV